MCLGTGVGDDTYIVRVSFFINMWIVGWQRVGEKWASEEFFALV